MFHLQSDNGKERLEKAELIIKDVTTKLCETYEPISVQALLLDESDPLLAKALEQQKACAVMCQTPVTVL